MADSDEEGTNGRDDGAGGPDLTSFLFGNIEGEGQLQEEFLDESTKKQLNSLGNLLTGTNLNSIVREVSIEAEEASKEIEEEDFDEKAADAEDYSDIKEMMDDDSSSEDSDDDDEDGDVENGTDQTVKSEETQETGEDTASAPPSESGSSVSASKVDSDTLLMPPPPPGPIPDRSPAPALAAEAKPSSSSAPTVSPLAAMLPEKYRNVDVKTFFPEFRENSVLRFSKLFPIKESHKPRTWKALKKRRRKELGQESEEGEPIPKEKRGWDYKVPLPTDPNAYQECQSVRFHKLAEVEKEEVKEEKEVSEPEKKGPKPTDWRWGPAQYWYDMLELPEEVPDYDYGLKIRNKEEQRQVDSAVAGICNATVNSKKEEEKLEASLPGPSGVQQSKTPAVAADKIEFPADAFHMVTQLNWEEDVIWNGEDIKHKVLSKLNSKSNAAGWVPSSMSRTAGSFSQRPGVKPELQIRLATLGKKLPENDDDTWYSIFPVENEELVYGKWEDEVIWDTENMPKKLEPRIVSLDPR